jgi:cation transport ATPase
MPSRKQRKKREKSFRHEWEYVELDPETGEERAVAPAALKADKPAREKRAPQKQQRRASSRREPQPPTWTRVWKRTAMFAPLMALFMYWTASSSKTGGSATAVAVQTLVLVAFFAPFSYLVDSMTYKLWAKRAAKTSAR